MTGNQFRAIRKRLSQGRAEFGWTLGFKGNYNTVQRRIMRTEALREKPIPEWVLKSVTAMLEKEPKGDLFERPQGEQQGA